MQESKKSKIHSFESSGLLRTTVELLSGRLSSLPPVTNSLILFSVSVSAAFLAAPLYLRNQEQELSKTSGYVAGFRTSTVRKLKASVALKLDDKSSHMDEAPDKELASHNDLHRTLTQLNLRSNEWRDQLGGVGFQILKLLEAWSLFNWLPNCDMPTHRQLEASHQDLNNTIADIKFFAILNEALLLFKLHDYLGAERCVENALAKLDARAQSSSTPFSFAGLTSDDLRGHAYHIKAKIAQAQGNDKQAGAYYKKAIAHRPDHPELMASQIGFYCDCIQHLENPILRELPHFVKDEDDFKAIVQALQGNDFGLANLGWVMLQPTFLGSNRLFL